MTYGTVVAETNCSICGKTTAEWDTLKLTRYNFRKLGIYYHVCPDCSVDEDWDELAVILNRKMRDLVRRKLNKDREDATPDLFAKEG